MRSSAVVVLGIVAFLCFCLTGFSHAAAGKQGTAPVLKASSKTGLVSLGPQPEPPDFPIMSVRQLRTQQKGLTLVEVRRAGTLALPAVVPSQMQRVEPGAGSPAYSEGDGVVLRVLQPLDTATGSTLTVRGILWSERVRQEVLEGNLDTSFAIGVHTAYQLVANAYFQQLPSAAHTYMLTIGTSAEASRLSVRVGGRALSASQLVASPGTSEVRALFSYEAGSQDNRLVVLVRVSSVARTNDYVHFHHVQLARVD